MTTRLLLTTVAVTALTLSGCGMWDDGHKVSDASSVSAPTEPVSGDPATAAAIAEAEAPGAATGGDLPEPSVTTAAAPNEPVSGDPNTAGAETVTSYVVEEPPSTGDATYDAGVSTAAAPNEPVSGDIYIPEAEPATSYTIDDSSTIYSSETTDTMSTGEDTTATIAPAGTETGNPGADEGVSTAAAPNEPVSGTGSGAGETNNTAASEACYEKGGSVVQWYDADGKTTDACRTSEGAEYSLTDYLTYGG